MTVWEPIEGGVGSALAAIEEKLPRPSQISLPGY